MNFSFCLSSFFLFLIFVSRQKAEEIAVENLDPNPNLSEDLLPYVNDSELEKHLEPDHNKNAEIAVGDDFVKEWEEIMGNFVPEDIKTFFIDDEEEEVVIFKQRGIIK